VNQGEEKVHGAPLGAVDLANTKTKLGFNPEQFFHVPAEVSAYWSDVTKKNQAIEAEWNTLYAKYKQTHPKLSQELERRFAKKLPENFRDILPKYTPADSPIATRKLSETLLNKIADDLPELFGGSADLTGSNLTRWKTAKDYQHVI
jgi:transketolase